ncbi:MAG: insulinase family protein, partial [Dehalococcoidia bacterium]|nr:insulinase family protein [Dehalococcoidia bacterium]
QVTAAEGHDLDDMEAAVDAEIRRLSTEPPTDEEINRVKNRIESSHYRQLTRIGGFGGLADQLNHYNIMAGDPEMVNTSLDRYLAVKREDIMRVHESVLDHRQVRLRVMPEQPLKPMVTAVDRWKMPEPAPEPSFTPPLPVRHQLANGMSIAVVESRGAPIVSFALVLRAGAVSDPEDLPGLASFTAQMLMEGTEGRTSLEIANAAEFIGARISSDARREYTLLSSETLTKHFPTALELVADLVKQPTFPEHELERVRREHLTDLRRSKDDPTSVAERLVAGLVFSKDSGYGHYIFGTEDSASALTRVDLQKLFQGVYTPGRATLVVVGDTNLEEVTQQAQDLFGDWSGEGSYVPQEAINTNGTMPSTTIYLVDQPGAAQSVIRALQPTIPRKHPDYFGLTLVNYVFGGQFSARLNQNLRQDKGYSYGYQSSVHWYQGTSLVSAGGSVQTEVTKESVQETLKEFQEIRGGRPITGEELDAAKAGILQGYPASFERSGMVLHHLIQLLVFDLPDDYFQSVGPGITAVSLEDAHRVAAERIKDDSLQLLVVGDREKIEVGLRELGLPVVLMNADGEKIG